MKVIGLQTVVVGIEPEMQPYVCKHLQLSGKN